MPQESLKLKKKRALNLIRVLKEEYPNCQDLIQNPRVLKQHKFGHKLGLLSNFFLMGVLGFIFNDFSSSQFFLP